MPRWTFYVIPGRYIVGMELIMNTSVAKTTDSVSQEADLGTTDLEGLLEAVGISFTVVDRCLDPVCAVCAQKGLSAAA